LIWSKVERLTGRVEDVGDLLVHGFSSILCRRLGLIKAAGFAGFLRSAPWLSGQVARLCQQA
jgi:hypothetical protein